MAESLIPNLRIETIPLPEYADSSRVVHVTIPAKVAFDLKRMEKVTARVLEQLGHDQCHSGWDIRFAVENRFVFDEKLKMKDVF